jgi:hypothetical protein
LKYVDTHTHTPPLLSFDDLDPGGVWENKARLNMRLNSFVERIIDVTICSAEQQLISTISGKKHDSFEHILELRWTKLVPCVMTI